MGQSNPRRRSVLSGSASVIVCREREGHTLKWWMRDSMDSFMEARGGGTILWSSTLMAPVGILLRHCWVSVVSRSRDAKTNLVNNPQRLSELLDSTQVSVVYTLSNHLFAHESLTHNNHRSFQQVHQIRPCRRHRMAQPFEYRKALHFPST